MFLKINDSLFENIPEKFERLFGVKPRPQQIIAIEQILRTYESGYGTVFLKADTGIGKSLVNIYICHVLGGGYIITSSRALQEQYKNDPLLKNVNLSILKGRSNYLCLNRSSGLFCELLKKYNVDTIEDLEEEMQVDGKNANNVLTYCDGGSCMDGDRCVMYSSGCYYYDARHAAENSLITVLNVAMFYYLRFIDAFTPRPIVVYDEAHSLDSFINMISEKAISTYFIKKLTGEYVTDLKTYGYNEFGIHDISPEAFLEKFYDKFKSHESEIINEQLKGLLNLITMVLSDPQSYDIKFSDNYRKLSLSIIDVRPFFKVIDSKYPGLRLHTSATIDHHFHEMRYGINCNKFVELSNDWDIKNFPIIFLPCGEMKIRNEDIVLPKISSKIIKIVSANKFKDSHGIIHCISKNLLEKTYNILSGIGLTDRLLRINSTIEFKRILRRYREDLCYKNKILITSSLNEGVDLKYDLARFCIILKPVRDYNEKITALFPEYTAKNFAETFSQQCGRCVRSDTDTCFIFIFDSEFDRLLKFSYRKFLSPQWAKAYLARQKIF